MSVTLEKVKFVLCKVKMQKVIVTLNKLRQTEFSQKLVDTRKRMKNIFNLDFDSTWGSFCSSSNIGGLAQIHSSKTKLRKGFWISVFILLIALSVWRCSTSFQLYYSFNTTTSTTIDIVDEIGKFEEHL